MSVAESSGLVEKVQELHWQVGVWHDLGYEVPPSPECKSIPPLGERSADAIRGGHAAIKTIDELVRELYTLRSGLVDELRKDSDLRAVRIDAMLARHKREREEDQTC